MIHAKMNSEINKLLLTFDEILLEVRKLEYYYRRNKPLF